MLIVLEGLDGAGKTTQVNMLKEYFEAKEMRTYSMHFPRFNSPVYGELIAAFLRGELGDVNTVNPKIAALLYAGDRKHATPVLKMMIEEEFVVILDRYVYSNIAFQCAKIEDEIQREKLCDWIVNLEYSFFKIPRPNLNIFLDVPCRFIADRLKMQREGDEREYLKGKTDIHESNLDLQEKVRKVYLEQIEQDKNFVRIDCVGADAEMKTPQEINAEIIETINLKIKFRPGFGTRQR